MRGVRGVRVGALLVALGLMVAACGGGDDEGDAGAGGDTADAKKVGLVYDIGGRGDQSFNDSAGAGLDAAKQEQAGKIEVKEIEPNADGSNRKELLDSLAPPQAWAASEGRAELERRARRVVEQGPTGASWPEVRAGIERDLKT